MAIIKLTSKPTQEQLAELAKPLDGYIKVVVDVETGIAAGGGALHADCEKVLLDNGSRQENLWGGGYDTETGDIDTMAFINIRPNQNNNSQEIIDQDVRQKVVAIIGKFFKDA